MLMEEDEDRNWGDSAGGHLLSRGNDDTLEHLKSSMPQRTLWKFSNLPEASSVSGSSIIRSH